MKKYKLYLLLCICLLTACSRQKIQNITTTSSASDSKEEISSVEYTIENQLNETEEMELRNLLIPMELETPEIKYTDMEQNHLDVYTKPLKDNYKFLGRFSDNGYAYILGISKTKIPVLRDLDGGHTKEEEGIRYVQLGKWINEGERFEKAYDLRGVLSFAKSEDGRLIYLGIKQYSDLGWQYSNLREVFHLVVNENRLEYVNQLHEKQLRAIIPFDTAYISMHKWEHGEMYNAYKPISYDELHTIMNDKTVVESSKINTECVHIFDKMNKTQPYMETVNQSLYEHIKDYFEIRSLDEITDIISIKLIRNNPEEQQSKIVTVEDRDNIDKIVGILKGSKVSYMGQTSYEDLLILTKEDGTEIELQIVPYSSDLFAGEGFILGSSVCYSPGMEEWIDLMEKYFNK